jgi:RNA polymerase sigma-70 factor (sigma-E family)
MAADESDAAVTLPAEIPRALAADGALGSVAAERDADEALTAIYRTHYGSLVRLAAFLVQDTAIAEEVVQDSFVAMHRGWRRLKDSDKALRYLRRSVVSRSRAALRHRAVACPETPEQGTDQWLRRRPQHSAAIAALYELPARQREAVVLRFYGDLPEAQVASIMGISRGAVRNHTARASATLRAVLEQQA